MMAVTLIGPAGHSATRHAETARSTAHGLAQTHRQLMAAMIVRGLAATRKCPFATRDLVRVRNDYHDSFKRSCSVFF